MDLYLRIDEYSLSFQICNGYLINLIEQIYRQILEFVQWITSRQKNTADTHILKVNNYQFATILNVFNPLLRNVIKLSNTL